MLNEISQALGSQLDGQGERKGYRGVKKMEVCYIYAYEDSTKKPIKYSERKGKEKKERRKRNIMKG
jgi:hypothetical protein